MNGVGFHSIEASMAVEADLFTLAEDEKEKI